MKCRPVETRKSTRRETRSLPTGRNGVRDPPRATKQTQLTTRRGKNCELPGSAVRVTLALSGRASTTFDARIIASSYSRERNWSDRRARAVSRDENTIRSAPETFGRSENKLLFDVSPRKKDANESADVTAADEQASERTGCFVARQENRTTYCKREARRDARSLCLDCGIFLAEAPNTNEFSKQAKSFVECSEWRGDSRKMIPSRRNGEPCNNLIMRGNRRCGRAQ